MRYSVGGGLGCLFFLAVLAGGARAEELIVTGTRLAAEEQKLPSASTVLDEDEIRARGDAGVSDLLRDIPGIQVVQPGAGGVTQLFIRGGEPNFTVFLLDGIRVNDLNNTRGGSFDLASLNLMGIEKVEIVRGPQSSVYGSDGLAGVINFITAGGGGAPAATVEGEAGGDEFSRASVQVQGPVGDGGFSAQFTTRDDGEAVAGSTYQADTASGRLRLNPGRGLAANLYARYADTDSTTFPEQSGGPELAVLRDTDSASATDFSIGADVDWTLTPIFSVQAQASYYDRSDRYASPGIAPGDMVPPNGASNDLERDNVALRFTARRGEMLTGTAGVDFQRESGDSDGYVDFGPGARLPNTYSLDRDIVGVFAEGRAQVASTWLIEASLRHDDPDAASGETTARIGTVFSPNDGATRLRANWGTGFKLPSFFALGSPLVGNPDLKPEKSHSLEVGVIQRLPGDGEVSLAVFDNEFKDLIDFDSETFSSVNRDKVTARGVEGGLIWPISPTLAWRAHVTWVDIEVKGSDRQLLQRPDWRGGAALRWLPAADWSLDLDWLYVGDTLDNSIPTGLQTLDAYHRVDVNVAWHVTGRLRLALAIDNLLDADYEEAIGFPAPGIRPRISARYSFGG